MAAPDDPASCEQLSTSLLQGSSPPVAGEDSEAVLHEVTCAQLHKRANGFSLCWLDT